MGDSLTSLPGWADLVIESFEPGYVRVAARGGLETRHFLPGDVPTDVLGGRTCDVMILLGTNDAGSEVPGEEFIENYEVIVDDLLFTHAVERIIINVPPRLFDEYGTLRPVQAELLFFYRMLLLDLCGHDPEDVIECGADLFVEIPPTHLLPDGTHFNALGHLLMYELVAEILPIMDLVEVQAARPLAGMPRAIPTSALSDDPLDQASRR